MPLSQERTPGCNQRKVMLLIGKVALQYPVPRTLSPFKGVENVGGYCLGRGTFIAAWTLIAILSRYEVEAEKHISMLFI